MSEPRVLNAPDRIYLQAGELIDDVLFGDMRDVTWCDHAIVDSDVPYVRADLHAAAEARVRELEAALAEDRLWPVINGALKGYRLTYTHDEDGDCLDLVDALTPPGDEDVARGVGELGYLAEAIAAALVAVDAEGEQP